jgi:hypothetical protein
MKYQTAQWYSGVSYNVNDGVFYNGVDYICTTAHTSTSTFDATKFSILTSADTYVSPVLTQIRNDRFIAVDLVEVHIKNTSNVMAPLYLTNANFNVQYDSATAPDAGVNTYLAQGNFMGFSTVPEEFDVKVGKFTIFLSAVDNDYITRFKDTEIEGKRVVIYKAFLDYNTLAVLNRPAILFDGIIMNVAITESARTCSISVDCSTLFSDYERTNGRKTNTGSNTLYQGIAYDTSMNKSGFTGNTEFKWGKI